MTITIQWTHKHGGGVIAGADAAEVVRNMAAAAYLADEMEPDRYMHNVSHRAYLYNGSDVRTHRPELFLADLERAGMITIEGEADQ